MIFDDMWSAGLKNLYTGETPFPGPPTIFRVPYKIGAGDDPLLLKLAPLNQHKVDTPRGPMKPVRGGMQARAPYAEMAIVSEQREQSVLLVSKNPPAEMYQNIADGFTETWTLMLVTLFEGMLWPNISLCGLHEDGSVVHFLSKDRGHPFDASQPCRLNSVLGNPHAAEFSVSTEHYELTANHMAFVAAATNALLNLKNISTEDIRPDIALQRARARRGQHPLFSYRILRIVPFSELRNRARGTPTGAMLPLHWVRGHIKRFTPERPLFGKLSGDFWWQPALHGRDKTRFADKSYEIVA